MIPTILTRWRGVMDINLQGNTTSVYCRVTLYEDWYSIDVCIQYISCTCTKKGILFESSCLWMFTTVLEYLNIFWCDDVVMSVHIIIKFLLYVLYVTLYFKMISHVHHRRARTTPPSTPWTAPFLLTGEENGMYCGTGKGGNRAQSHPWTLFSGCTTAPAGR